MRVNAFYERLDNHRDVYAGDRFAVRWTKQGAVTATKSGLSLPAPRSASLPAKRYEIPPSGHRP